ncbi:hypothetical protein CBM2587_B100103 [Cupriavidus taiwanensis]|uniref:Uncharacterized protein n=1 Tax=Cupriavidus taiwanensis TaxID=164546 RepID=A0A975X6I3_9BURK|nr:hypothetical protein CBM2587_B100103 [Cupriavidus taiwanensis]
MHRVQKQKAPHQAGPHRIVYRYFRSASGNNACGRF